MDLIAATRAEGGLVFFIRTSKNQVKLKMFLGFLRGVKLDIKNVLKIQCIFKKKSR